MMLDTSFVERVGGAIEPHCPGQSEYQESDRRFGFSRAVGEWHLSILPVFLTSSCGFGRHALPGRGEDIPKSHQPPVLLKKLERRNFRFGRLTGSDRMHSGTEVSVCNAQTWTYTLSLLRPFCEESTSGDQLHERYLTHQDFGYEGHLGVEHN